MSNLEMQGHSRESRVLILSDGKPGHYNQSLGIMDRLNGVSAETIQVRFKRKWRDDVLRVFARLLAGVNLSHRLIRAVLKWSMESSSAVAVLGAEQFDVILSTGSSVAAPNLLLGQLMGAKTAVCTRPSPVGIAHFDLAILPEHMRPRRRAVNTAMTLGVPNRITPEYVNAAGAALLRKLDIRGRRIIGLLMGGEDRHYSIPPEMASSLCHILLDICEGSGMRLALTTSRRTDPESESVIRSRTSGNSLCCFSVLSGDPQQESPVPGILGMSDLVIVTEDSFSMVCEAASSGKKTVILEVKRRKSGDPKRRRIYRMLIERGYARSADISNLRDVILDFVEDSAKTKALNDAQTAADALHKLMTAC